MKASDTSKARTQTASPTLPQKPRQRFARFDAPEDVLIDLDLGRHERVRVLEDWKRELESDSGITQPGEMLRRVNACRRLLSEQEY